MNSLWNLATRIHAFIIRDISKPRTENMQFIETETLKFKVN